LVMVVGITVTLVDTRENGLILRSLSRVWCEVLCDMKRAFRNCCSRKSAAVDEKRLRTELSERDATLNESRSRTGPVTRVQRRKHDVYAVSWLFCTKQSKLHKGITKHIGRSTGLVQF
jgi:hypothetical protein